MLNHRHYKFFVGVTSIVMLIVGLSFGVYLDKSFDTIDFEVVNMGLAFIVIFLLLIICGLALEMREILQAKGGKKR